MDTLEECSVDCPYCGERISVLLDQQDVGNEYIEDCQVCCRPIIFNLVLDESGNLSAWVRDENEAF